MHDHDADSTLPPRGPVVQGDEDRIRTDARYEVLEPLGTGTFGVVYRVKDTLLGRTAAMKILRERYCQRPDVVARFIDEAQAAAQLQHPGILPVYELGWLPDGAPFYTMREVHGATLKEAFKNGALPKTTQIDAVLRACEAMGYAHRMGVIHRDLKPSNILLGSHGEVLVVDWGLAKVVDPDKRLVKLSRRRDETLFRTASGQVAGTPAYMPPEQAAGVVSDIDARSDVYAIGAILYHLWAGHPAYTGVSSLHIRQDVLRGPPRPLAEVSSAPVEWVAVVERAMDRDPKARFEHAGALAAALREL